MAAVAAAAPGGDSVTSVTVIVGPLSSFARRKLLLAGNQDTDSIVAFAIDPVDGALRTKGCRAAILPHPILAEVEDPCTSRGTANSYSPISRINDEAIIIEALLPFVPTRLYQPFGSKTGL
jgi:hypothetical protein